jgi:rod shape-determining protein MreD
MAISSRRQVEVYRMRPAVLGVAVCGSVLLQAVLPLAFPRARFLDLPLLVVIYFAIMRRSRLFGIGLGTGVGLLQDALSHYYIGLFGMSKALVAFLAAWVSVKFDLEQLLARFILAGALVLIHSVFHYGLERALLDPAPPFVPLDLASGLLFNMAAALILFPVLDRFKRTV